METTKKKKGFALMSLEKRQSIASMGGKMAHIKGTAHQWTTEEAKIAGKKGGKAFSKRKIEEVNNNYIIEN